MRFDEVRNLTSTSDAGEDDEFVRRVFGCASMERCLRLGQDQNLRSRCANVSEVEGRDAADRQFAGSKLQEQEARRAGFKHQTGRCMNAAVTSLVRSESGPRHLWYVLVTSLSACA